MGLFSYVFAGCGFILIGAWESLSLSSSNPKHEPATPSSPLSRVNADPISRPNSGLTPFISGSLLSVLVALNALVSMFDAISSSDRIGSAVQLQVLAIALLFLLYSLLGTLVSSKKSFFLPSEILDSVLLFALVEEFLLFYMQRKDPNGIENRYFDLLLVPISVCVVSTVLELKSKRSSVYQKLARGVGFMLQGTWFIQMGFSFFTGVMVQGCSLYEKSKGNFTVKCKSHPEYHRGKAIATLQFNLHLALVMVLVVCCYSVLARVKGIASNSSRYTPLGAENGQVESSGTFTLDSDDELDDGIKLKGPVVEMVANGHSSHH